MCRGAWNCFHHPHQDAGFWPIALGLHCHQRNQQLDSRMRLDEGVAGELAKAGERVETLEDGDEKMDVVETEVFCQLAVHSLLQKPLDEVLVDLLAAQLVEDVKAGDDLETVLSANAPGEGGEEKLGHSIVVGLFQLDFCRDV